MTGALRQPFHDEETYDARFTTPPRRTEGLRLVGMAVAESPEWKRKKKAPAAAAPVG
jgi:hypothetical protein